LLGMGKGRVSFSAAANSLIASSRSFKIAFIT
jgi:hypothetical protein